MKIPEHDPLRPVEPGSAGVTGPDKAGASRRADADQTAPRDRVDLSEAARELVVLNRALDSLPDVRDERVADVRQRIEAGRYDASAEKIADKLIESAVVDRVM